VVEVTVAALVVVLVIVVLVVVVVVVVVVVAVPQNCMSLNRLKDMKHSIPTTDVPSNRQATRTLD